MYPSLLAEETKAAVTEYLSTTFALADDDARAGLEEFLLDPAGGIFRGPYLRVRTPFQPVAEPWQAPLDWLPAGFRPYAHQARAFARLSSRDSPAEPTIVTTGTGSGKTEAFLIPLLDHAARAKARGEPGIKALLLYPMNALVTDQERRIAEYLHDEPGLRGVTGGVYIGGRGRHTEQTREHLVDYRPELRRHPPDVLLSNYKMLDLLLLRSADAPLWAEAANSLAYLVLDEFHTYDGAQGTDVAMLLRRLGATLRVAEPGRPLGRITPVATSATLGGATRSAELRHFAETVFGTPFDEDAVVGEERVEAAEVVSDVDFELGIPEVSAVTRLPCPDAATPRSWQPLAREFLGEDIPDEQALGHRLAQSFLTRATLQVLSGGPLTVREAVDAISSSGVLQWGVAKQRTPGEVEAALLRFLALVSAARVPAGSGHTRPLCNVEVQLWLREVTRMLRAVDTVPRFAWWHDGAAEDEARFLPAAYCRVCGRSGWAALATELGEVLDGEPRKVWQASIGEPADVRTVLLAGEGEPEARRLDGDTLAFCGDGEPGIPVLVTPGAEAAVEQRCPSCNAENAIRFLGSSVATLVSVALTQVFGSDLVPETQKKTLVFTDSVQDAAHRAAFIEGRAFQFNLRSAVLAAAGGEPRALPEVTATLTGAPVEDLYALAPPDFVRRLGLSGEWLAADPHGRRRALLENRLSFQAQLELGLRSRLGRTLELTGALAVDLDIDLDRYAELARATHENLPERGTTLPETAAYRVWLLGLTDRLRRRGGIQHPWLTTYLARDGNRWPVTGGAPAGMQGFPRGRPAPVFFTTSTAAGAEFDSLRPRGDSWLSDWTARALGLGQVEARALLEPVVRLLADGEAAPLIRHTSGSGATLFGLNPERLLLGPLDDEALGSAQLHCPDCHHIQPVPPARAADWRQAPCPRARCRGRLAPHPAPRENFYRRLYRSGRLRHLVTHEHTALLEDETRQDVERRFASGDSPVDPNVLACTPTLELGIDIGDLSVVALASLPRAPANYLQRVGRAGRSTGNAFVVATVPATPRELYYLAEPKYLIDGAVTPPATYLAASELLARQYLAFCLDRVAAGEIELGHDMPERLGPLLHPGLAEGSWLRRFVDTVTERSEELANEFLALFAGHLDEPAREGVRAFAAGGLAEAVAHASREWAAQVSDLQARQAELARAIAELDNQGHLDDAQTADRRRFSGESKALTAQLTGSWQQNALSGLGALALLPNYNLRDDATELDVSLWWTSDDAEPTFQATETTYQRASRAALTEFAPGAFFYARGARVEIDALEIGPVGQPHWRCWRLCPDCGWGTDLVEPTPGACPRCGSTGVCDTGAVHQLLELRRVSAVHRRDDVVIEDEAEDRTRIRFTTVTGVDIAPEAVAHAWRLAGKVFGAEYAREATIRTVNLGRAGKPGSDTAIAGERHPAPRFATCAYCGVVRAPGRPDEQVHHRGWCSTRRGTPTHWEELALSHEITTQAVRLLLPVSTFAVETRLASFKTAVLLGLRRDFGGDPQHLDVVTAQMPDEHRRPRRFLVLHDTVPGGTGYLDRFGDPDRMREILTQAHQVLATCPCQSEGHAACHRCLLGVAAPGEVEHTDRRVALDMLAELLADWQVEGVDSVTGIDIAPVGTSELELRFREQLKAWVETADGHSWASSLGARGEELDLRLSAPGGAARRWSVRPLVPITTGGIATEPDFLLVRQDAQDARVAVYLDGLAFHASPEADRTADDARKRSALRDDGTRVWSLSWDDVEDFARVLDGHAPKQAELLDTSAANRARSTVPDPRVSLLWGNPVAALLGYLQDPAAHVWEQAATHTCLGMLGSAQHRTAAPVPTTAASLATALDAWAHGEPTTPEPGDLVFGACRGRSGLPIAVVGSTTGAGTDSVGALAVLDDRPAEVGGPAHGERWRDWLRWSNLLQFLTLPRYGHTMPLRMAEVWTDRSLPDFRGRPIPLAAPSPAAAAVVDVVTPPWQVVIDYADPSLAELARKLAGLGVPAPEVGDELDDGRASVVEYSWPARRYAVVIDDNEQRDTWLAEHGWRVWRADGAGQEQEHEEDMVAEIAAAFEVGA
jgi:ATP-dependent helicase YprA (DUF1998 family)